MVNDTVIGKFTNSSHIPIVPFPDGNGRVGRLMITLFLMEKKLLRTPALYISYYLKQNRIEYYDRMSEVRSKDNYE